MLLFTRSLLTKRFCLMSNERFIFTRSQSRNCFFLCFFSSLAHYEANVSICLLTIIWYVILLAHYKKMFLFLSWNERSHARHCSLFSACVLSNQRFFLLCCRIEHSSSISWKRFLSVCWNERCQMRHYSPRQKNTVSDVFSRSNKRFSSPRWNERGQVTHQYDYQVNVFSSLDRDLTTSLSLYLSLPFLYS